MNSMKQDQVLSVSTALIIDLIEECAFQHKAYTTEVLAALLCVHDILGRSGESGDSGRLREQFHAFVESWKSEHMDDVPGCSYIRDVFCWDLKTEITTYLDRNPSERSVVEILNVLVEHYEQMAHPKAFDLLAALAKQSDLDHAKRQRESKMLAIASLEESGIALPEVLQDLSGFSSSRFKHLAAVVPEGQSILDIYILNQIRHCLSRGVPTIIDELAVNAIPRNIHFGTLELSTPGAQIQSVEGADEYLVVLSRAIWTVTSLATGIIAGSAELDPYLLVPIGPDNDAMPRLAPSIALLDRVLRCDIVDFEFPAIHDNQHKLFWEQLDSYTKSFVFGHEYAHVLLGHVGDNYGSGADVALLWNHELHADIIGFKLVLANARRTLSITEELASSNDGPQPGNEVANQVRDIMGTVTDFYVVAGAALVFFLYWRMEALQGVRTSTHSTHPPYLVRLASLWKYAMGVAVDFEKVFSNTNLMLSHFISSMPIIEGAWQDRFAEEAFRPLLFHSYESVIDMVEKVNTTEPHFARSLDSARRRLESLFREEGTPYEDKYTALEGCAQILRICRDADPLRSINEVFVRAGL